MDLQISVFLLFIVFTAAHSLSCYKCMGRNGSCAGQTVKTCPSGSSQCMSLTMITPIGNISREVKVKDCYPACQNGSLNLGSSKSTYSCCDTDLCNVQDTPDHPSIFPNGKKCFSCDDQSCSTVSCSGTEDRCVKATAIYGDLSVLLKGCVSKSICDAAVSAFNNFNLGSVSCCEGSLCNGAQSVSQSFLFLCCSLLSYFLLH
ncbi:urokinase plasminogen activator surface receptor-like [Megalobrama amblycephala]|uniref:urokinase plasminogen activator surface receptor-like n=1 Tax=Megalobrama amblycephala TaxID=75352 RepID=UPI002014540B|nr:urokinase plasminogen activator surface receptor-like [Megalobrama amblycephala]